MQKTMYMMIGVSGSGKTRWAANKTKELRAQPEPPRICYHSYAKCRRYFASREATSGSIPSIDKVIAIVSKDRDKFLEFYEKRKRKDFSNADVIIVDGTNLISEHRDPYVTLADELGFKKIAVIVEADMETILERHRNRVNPIPDTLLSKQMEEFKTLDVGLAFDVVIHHFSSGVDPMRKR